MKNESMRENEIAKIVVSIPYNIHKSLGHGLCESVYETIMDMNW